MAALAVAAGCAIVVLLLAAATQARSAALPVITGDAVVGETLTSSSAGDSPLYRWQRCDPAASPCTEGDGDGSGAGWALIAGAEQQSYTLTDSDLGFLIRVRAKGTSLGEQFSSSEPAGPVEAAPTPPGAPVVATTPSTAALQPDNGQTLLISALQGIVLIKIPGDTDFRPVTDIREIPVGSLVDATQGTAQITSENGDGVDELASFWGGVFVALQNSGAGSVFEARLESSLGRRAKKQSSPRIATTAAVAHTAAAGSKLWGSGSGKFRTRGRGGAATLRGTTWLTKDKGDGTLFKVLEGHGIDVKDFGKKGLITLTPGEKYFAH